MQAQQKVLVSTEGRVEEEFVSSPHGSEFPGIIEGHFEVRLARNSSEIATALRLRHRVFSVEIGGDKKDSMGAGLEFDTYDFRCRHLIVLDRDTGETVGTYRLNTIETAGGTRGFYSSNEFTVGELPSAVLQNGIEIGRACIAKEHRNTKVLFLLWKGLLRYLEFSCKNYFFGCCSMFTQDERAGAAAYWKLMKDGHFHDDFWVTPYANGIDLTVAKDDSVVTLPSLFNMYLRIGAKVCGPPMIDREFGTIDFFVVFDVTQMNEKYRRMFAA